MPKPFSGDIRSIFLIMANPWSAACPSRAIVGVLASKWVLLVFPILYAGPKRNGELLREIEGISQKVLTQTLRELERYGLVSRSEPMTKLRRVAYSLTPLGASLAVIVQSLDQWVIEHAPLLLAATEADGRPT